MPDPVTDKELMVLYRQRRKDRERWKGRRRRQLEAPPKSIGELLNLAFRNDPTASQKFEEAKALAAWPALVGDVVARHAIAERLKGDLLIIRVSDPLWMHELGFLKPELLKKYRRNFSRLAVRDIFFVRSPMPF